MFPQDISNESKELAGLGYRGRCDGGQANSASNRLSASGGLPYMHFERWLMVRRQMWKGRARVLGKARGDSDSSSVQHDDDSQYSVWATTLGLTVLHVLYTIYNPKQNTTNPVV